MAELDAHGAAACVEVGGRIGDDGTILTITTIAGEPVSAGTGDNDDGLEIARALIAANGGMVEVPSRGQVRDRVITILLPGARSA